MLDVVLYFVAVGSVTESFLPAFTKQFSEKGEHKGEHKEAKYKTWSDVPIYLRAAMWALWPLGAMAFCSLVGLTFTVLRFIATIVMAFL